MCMIVFFNVKCYLGVLMFIVYFISYGQCDFQPLLLSPYLQAGRVDEARERALVVPDMNGWRSYSGFFTVNQDCGNNLFFWFFQAQINWEEAPVLLWMNGGPGSSSLIGTFLENGPFKYTEKEGFTNNTFTWARDNNVLYLDQPAGTGFSFTTGGCYATNLSTVAKETYSAISQFFTLFAGLQKNKFFLTGESYCGHYIPAIASEIHDRNEAGDGKINLIGMAIGNAFIDVRCLKDSSYLFELGVIDMKTRDIIAGYEAGVVEAINEGNFSKVENLRNLVIKTGIRMTGIVNPYNILLDSRLNKDFATYLKQCNVRKQLHVGNTSYNIDSEEVYTHLKGDIYVSSAGYIVKLLNTKKYIMLFYSGQLDAIVPYTSLECVLSGLQWDGAAEYLQAARRQWHVGDRLAGWSKTSGLLTEVAVRGAGHVVPADQGEAALDLITALVNNDLEASLSEGHVTRVFI